MDIAEGDELGVGEGVVDEADEDCVGIVEELDEVADVDAGAAVVVVVVVVDSGADVATGVAAEDCVDVELTAEVELDDLVAAGETVREEAVDGAVGSTTTGGAERGVACWPQPASARPRTSAVSA